MNKLRTVTIFLAILGAIFLIVGRYIPINIGVCEDIAWIVSGIFVALGILTNTGKDPEPLTWITFIEKLKSPLAVASIYALLAYIVYLRLAPEQADIILRVVDMIVIGIFGFSVYNNPNNRDAIR